MEILRDPVWQSIGAATAIIALLLYIYVERDKASKLYSAVLTRLRATLDYIVDIVDAAIHGIGKLLNVLLFFALVVFILVAPVFLYKELIQHQSLNLDPFIIDSKSMIYGLVVIGWCLSILTFRHRLVINELRSQIDYLNRLPDIKRLKNKYNKQLFDSAIKQWDDFRAELLNKHDDSPFALDLASCFPLDVQDETLIVACPNRVIYKRMNPSTSEKEYDEKMRDKRLIEELAGKRFQVMRISYTFEEKRIT